MDRVDDLARRGGRGRAVAAARGDPRPGPRQGGVGLAACVEPGHLRGFRRRSADRSGRAEPRLEQLRVEAALPQLRRDVPAEPTSVLGFSLGNGWYRGRLSWNGHRDFYGDRLGAGRPARGRVRRRPPAARGHRRDLGGRSVGGPRRRPLRRPDDRRAAARRLLVASRSCAGGVGGGRGGAVRRAAAGAVRRTTGGPSREQTPGRDLDLALGTDVGGLRAEPGRLAALHGARRGGPRDHAAARGGAGGRRAGRPPAAHGRGHRPARAQRWRRLLRADQDVPRVPVRRGQRLAQ